MAIIQNPCSLPEDMIFEILFRVSLQTLQLCRLTLDKNQMQATYQYNFMKQYCQRKKTVLGFYILVSRKIESDTIFVHARDSNPDQSMSLKFLPEEVRIRAVSNQGGLMLCESASTGGMISNRFYVCKPTTKEWKRLPNPRTRFPSLTYAMAVLHSPPNSTKFHYKIIRFSEPRVQAIRYTTVLCEVYDSDMGKWKRLENIRLIHDLLHIKISHESSPVYCNGVFHWMTWTKQIFVFDINTQEWKLIPLPEELLNDDCYCYDIRLIQLEGKLALFHEKGDQTGIWVIDNYLEGNWKLREVMNTNKKTLVNLCTSDIAVYFEKSISDHKLVWYNFQTGTCTATNIGNMSTWNAFRLESDSEPVFTST